MKDPATRRSTALVLLLTLLATATKALAADPVALRWRLEAGKVLHYALEQVVTRDSRPEGGRGVHTERRQEVRFHWTVGKVEGDVAEVTLAIDRVYVRIEADGRPVDFEYDTAKGVIHDDGPYSARLVELLRGLPGSEVSFRLSARGEISDVKPSPELLAAIRQAGALGGASLFSEEGLRNLIVQTAPLLPDAPVEPGATWSRQVVAPMPMLGALVVDRTYADRGPRGDAPDVHDVEVETRFSLRPMPEAALEMKLMGQSGKGTFAFDARAGLLLSGKAEEAMTLGITAGGQRVEQAATTRLEVKLVPSPAAPADPAPAPPVTPSR